MIGKILIVEYEGVIRELFSEIFWDCFRFNVRYVRDGEEGLRMARLFNPDPYVQTFPIPAEAGIHCSAWSLDTDFRRYGCEMKPTKWRYRNDDTQTG